MEGGTDERKKGERVKWRDKESKGRKECGKGGVREQKRVGNRECRRGGLRD